MSDNSILRTQLDGKDHFVAGGHGVISTAGATLHASRLSRIPVWALDDGKTKELLFRVFPKMLVDPKQKQRATRWLKIIHLYWRVGMTRAQVAHEIGQTENQTRRLIQNIVRAADGRRANGSGTKGGRVGRPKKIGVPIDATIDGSKGESIEPKSSVSL